MGREGERVRVGGGGESDLHYSALQVERFKILKDQNFHYFNLLILLLAFIISFS